jgi:hypothetical protein
MHAQYVVDMWVESDHIDPTIEIAWIVVESYNERIRGRKWTCNISKWPGGDRDLFFILSSWCNSVHQ